MKQLNKQPLYVLAGWLLYSPLFAWADNVSYSYDDLNRLVRVDYENGTVIEYSYDAAGNRTQQVVSPSTHRKALPNISTTLEKYHPADLEVSKQLAQPEQLPLVDSQASAAIKMKRSVAWSVVLGAFRDKENALKAHQRYKNAGQDVNVNAVERRGRTLYQLELQGRLGTAAEARKLASSVEKSLGLTGVWIYASP